MVQGDAKIPGGLSRRGLGDVPRLGMSWSRNLWRQQWADRVRRIVMPLRGAFATDPTRSPQGKRLAAELDRTHPDAAGRYGGPRGHVHRPAARDRRNPRPNLVCTNMIESMIGICRDTSRNVKRWRDEGDMRRGGAPPGCSKPNEVPPAPRSRQMPQLVTVLARHAEAVTPPCDTDQDSSLHDNRDHHPQRLQQRTASRKSRRGRGARHRWRRPGFVGVASVGSRAELSRHMVRGATKNIRGGLSRWGLGDVPGLV